MQSLRKFYILQYKVCIQKPTKKHGLTLLRCLFELSATIRLYGANSMYRFALDGDFQLSIVLTSGNNTLVIGLKDATDTQELYNTLLEKIAQ